MSISINPVAALHLEVLSGWKDIANYLGKGVRTVQRYESELKLPVHRPSGKPRGSVLATKTELDQWILASPTGKISTPPAKKPATRSKHSERSLRKALYEMEILIDEAKQLRSELTKTHQKVLQNLEEIRNTAQSKVRAIDAEENLLPELDAA